MPTVSAPRHCANRGESNHSSSSHHNMNNIPRLPMCNKVRLPWFTGKIIAKMGMALACASFLPVFLSTAAENVEPATAKEARFLAVLRSANAAPQDKAIACKQLAIYGSSNAVPALAELLSNPELASWARIALEAIPDPSADKALRDALPRLEGRLLVGAINSIGNRRDNNAVRQLAACIGNPDSAAASAAAAALGRIGGDPAVGILKATLSTASQELRSAAAEGCIRCAEQFLAAGNPAKAVELYDMVRKADVPKQRIAEATRGAILARKSAGTPILLEQLKSPDKTMFALGLRVAREIEGADVTASLAAALKQIEPARQPLLLMAIADRTDHNVLPAVREAATKGTKELQLTAAGLLENIGDTSCIDDLLALASGPDPDLARVAKSTLAKIGGTELDNELVARLNTGAAPTRQVLIEVAAQRQLSKAIPAITAAISDPHPPVRNAAIQAISALGGADQVQELVRLLQKSRPSQTQERDAIGQALVAVCGRAGQASAAHVLTLTKHEDGAVRVLALNALAAAGGPDALAAVGAALKDPDEGVQDEAVRTLSTWPNNWPEDTAVAIPLLDLVKSGRKTSHQILAARGYLECVRGDKKLTDDQKLGKVKDLLPLMKLAEEKRLAVTVLGTLPTSGSLDTLANLAADPAIAEEASSAMVSLAAKNLPAVTKEQRRKALETALATSSNEATKKRAQEALNKIR